MSDEMREALEIVSMRILEEAAFFFSDPMNDPSKRPDASWNPQGVELTWSGEVSEGAIRVWSDPGLLVALAANMLGVEEDDPHARSQRIDALGEVLNMVLGNCLTEAWGPGPVFKLGIPHQADPRDYPLDAETGFWLVAEGLPMMFWVGGRR
ncbi:MAG TPA: chemotaxis protein CheX [Fibrobacteria bacterium]|nr:chemotaxis protein CheX [Fibrobacteria bacterium]